MTGILTPHRPQPIRTFEIKAYVNAPLEGEFSDWPNSVQDTVLELLEKKAQQVELPLTLVGAACSIDHDWKEDGRPSPYFVHIIASEVVAMPSQAQQNEAERLLHKLLNGSINQ